MSLTLLQIKTDARNYLNAPQIVFLTDEMIIGSINSWIGRWCDDVRYPEATTPLTLLADQAYIDISALGILDKRAVYYGTDGSKPLDSLALPDVQQIMSNSTGVTTTEASPIGYFLDLAQDRLYFYSTSGEFTSTTDQTIVFRYSKVPTALVNNTDISELPTRYDYDLKHGVAHDYYVRAGNAKKAFIECGTEKSPGKWQSAVRKALARMNASKRDYPKTMRDGMAASRTAYIRGYSNVNSKRYY